MQAKFFPHDVIGKQPTKVGDKFKARFFGEVVELEVSEWCGGFWFANVL